MNMKLSGWTIWAKDTTTGKVRQFTIAEADEDKAVAYLQTVHKNLELISRHGVTPSVTDFLNLEQGKGMEWVSMDGGDLRPGGTVFGKPCYP